VALTDDIKEAMEQWDFLEGRLSGLIQKQDAEVSGALTDKSKYHELQSVISEVEKEQTILLSDIIQRPSGNLHDVVAKLNLWMGINAPAEDLWSNPSHKLIASALRDLSAMNSD